MWKQFTIQGNTQYLDILPKILEKYINKKRSSIKMTPVEDSKKKKEELFIFIKMVTRSIYHLNQNLK